MTTVRVDRAPATAVTGILSNGKWTDVRDAREVRSPYSGDIVGTMPVASAADAVAAAYHARRYRSTLTAYDRAGILNRTAAALEAASEEFARSICRESGLALKDARREVRGATAILRSCAEESTRLVGDAIPTDVTEAGERRVAITVREPVGLVCALTPFNRPLKQVVAKLAPALAANNRVVLKPSEKTPLTAYRFIHLLLAAGLPAEMVSIVSGDPETVGHALVTCEHVDLISFTGSAGVGRRIARDAGLVRTVFELGDSGALIVLDDADLQAAARAAAAGAFANSGQSCRGVKRLLVHERVADEFVSLMKEHASKMTVGDPMDPQTDIGTLITEEAALEVERRVVEAVQEGAQQVFGGCRQGAQYWPTVLDRVPPDARLVQEETFAPCAPIVRIRGLAEAIAMVNGSRYGLQAGLFTGSLGHALDAARRLEVGAVIVNGGPQFDSPAIPFGGVRDSGFGREGGPYGIAEMTTLKTVVL